MERGRVVVWGNRIGDYVHKYRFRGLIEGDAHLLRWDRDESFQFNTILSECGLGVWGYKLSDKVGSG